MITIETAHPLAEWSNDHLYPRGTINDNSTDAEFNQRLFDLFMLGCKPRLRLLDLGCSGGGFVRSVHDQGALAVGVEGSDCSLRTGRAEWSSHIAHLLFTADITQPFSVERDGMPLDFSVVTAWEVLEHIPEDKLDAVAANIRGHLLADGLFIGSVACCSDLYAGVEYHVTQRPPGWWIDWWEKRGFVMDYDAVAHFGEHWVRGPKHGETSSLCFVFRMKP